MCLLDFLFNDPPQFVRKPKQAKRSKQPKAKVTGTHTFTVQKAYCCPAEPLIRNALEPFGIPVTGFSEKVVNVGLLRHGQIKYKEEAYKNLPMAQEATFSVPAARAKQAEAWLWATGRIIVTDGNISKTAEAWGKQRNGSMPIAWDANAGREYARAKHPVADSTPYAPQRLGEPWIEPGCTPALAVWSKTNNLVKNGKGKKK